MHSIHAHIHNIYMYINIYIHIYIYTHTQGGDKDSSTVARLCVLLCATKDVAAAEKYAEMLPVVAEADDVDVQVCVTVSLCVCVRSTFCIFSKNLQKHFVDMGVCNVMYTYV